MHLITCLNFHKRDRWLGSNFLSTYLRTLKNVRVSNIYIQSMLASLALISVRVC